MSLTVFLIFGILYPAYEWQLLYFYHLPRIDHKRFREI